MTTLEKNILSAVLVAVAVYLKSPLVALMPVVLHMVKSAEAIWGKFTKDAAVVAMQSKIEAMEKKMDLVSMDINNVAQRAQTILGEGYR